MTVKELIDGLSKLPRDLDVFVYTDDDREENFYKIFDVERKNYYNGEIVRGVGIFADDRSFHSNYYNLE